VGSKAEGGGGGGGKLGLLSEEKFGEEKTPSTDSILCVTLDPPEPAPENIQMVRDKSPGRRTEDPKFILGSGPNWKKRTKQIPSG